MEEEREREGWREQEESVCEWKKKEGTK